MNYQNYWYPLLNSLTFNEYTVKDSFAMVEEIIQ